MTFFKFRLCRNSIWHNSIKTNMKQITAYISKLAHIYTGIIIKMSSISKLQPKNQEEQNF
jgi:hypothetical protein